MLGVSMDITSCTCLLMVILTAWTANPGLADIHTDGKNQTTVCLHNETANEVYLDCPSGVIRVLGHRAGFQDYLVGASCQSPDEDACAAINPELEVDLLNTCMGQSSCTVLVDRMYLDVCSEKSDYVLVYYQCIPDNSIDELSLVDVCGDLLTGNIVSRVKGAIHTPNYPNPYPPDLACSCHLSTIVPDGRIYLTMYDMDLAAAEDSPPCTGDWLEYGNDGNEWGEGWNMCEMLAGERMDVGTSGITINFKTSPTLESRGFWMLYEGQGSRMEPVEVRLDCSPIQPLIEKAAVLCVSQQNVSEVFLDCSSVGVIEVTHAVEGYSPMVEGQTCNYVHEGQCEIEANTKEEIFRMCMGAAECAVGVDMVPLPSCGHDTNYVQVDYTCIPNNNDPSVIVDVCGDAITTGQVRRRHGYIESPDYPAKYPHDLACYCHLVSDEDTTIRLKMLDIDLDGSDRAGGCGDDWLQFRRAMQGWGSGRPLCGSTLGNWIETQGNEIALDFHSGQDRERRGFWLEYSALNGDGVASPVSVICQKKAKRRDPGITNQTSTQTSQSTGLIIGLFVLIILMALMVAVLVYLRYKRSRNAKLSDPDVVVNHTPASSQPRSTFTGSAAPQVDIRAGPSSSSATLEPHCLPSTYINAAYETTEPRV